MKVFFQVFIYLNVGIGALFFIIWFLTSSPFFQAPAFAKGTSIAKPIGQKKEEPRLVQNINNKVPAETEKLIPANSAVKLKDKNVPAQAPNVPAQAPNVPAQAPNVPAQAPNVPAQAPNVPAQAPNAPAHAPNVPAHAPNAPAPSVRTEKGGASDSIAIDRAVSSSNSDNEKPVQRKGASVTESVPLPPSIPPSPEADDVPLPEDMDTKSSMSGGAPIPEGVSSDLSKLLESAKELQENQKAGSGASVAHDLMQINKQVAEIYKLLSNYNYDPSDRRDPFAPFQIEQEEEEGEENHTREVIPNYPTGKYDLSEIQLVGIKWSSKLGPSKALFKTPDNVIHPLQKNDRIGSNRGVIYQLREDEVVILEPRLGIAKKKEDAYVPIIVRLHRWMDQDRNESMDQHPPNQTQIKRQSKGV